MDEIILYEDQTTKLDLDTLVNYLNTVCKCVSFKKGETEVFIEEVPISCPITQKYITKLIEKETKKAYWSILFTEHPYDNNYFWNTADGLSIVTFYGWDYLTKLSRNNGVLYFIAAGLAMDIDNTYRHNETTGCVYDYLWDKTGIDLGMRCAFICSKCLTRISTKDLSSFEIKLFNDVKYLMNTLGCVSKWNNDISDWIRKNNKDSEHDDGFETSIHKLDFIPVENEGEIDVSRGVVDNICKGYLSLKDENISPNDKGNIFEDFSLNFFRLIKGWKLIDSNPNLGDCEIDLVYDISSGPLILKERLGNHIYIECKNRKKKSDARDISHFILNLISRNLKGGIFFSYNGITGYKPENWRSTDAAYKRIIDACRLQNIFVIPMVAEDIELIRNGGNLVNHLIDRLNRFVRI